jgi:hypothetical protein
MLQTQLKPEYRLTKLVMKYVVVIVTTPKHFMLSNTVIPPPPNFIFPRVIFKFHIFVW